MFHRCFFSGRPTNWWGFCLKIPARPTIVDSLQFNPLVQSRIKKTQCPCRLIADKNTDNFWRFHEGEFHGIPRSLPTKCIRTHPNSSELIRTHPNYLNYSLTIPKSRGFPRTKNRDPISGFMPGHHFRAGVQQPCCCGQVMGYPQSDGIPSAVGRTLDETMRVGPWKWAMPPPRMAILMGKMMINKCIYWPYESIWYIYIYNYIYIYKSYIGCSLDPRTASANWAAVIPKHISFFCFFIWHAVYKWVS